MAKAKESKKETKTSSKTYHNYIGGEWMKSSSGEWFENLNPADTSDVVGRFPRSNQEDVNRAVEAAKETATRWRRTPAPKRAEILFKLARILERDKEQFSRGMTREMGKVLKESGGDVQEAIDCTYFTAGEGRRLHGFTTKAEMPNKYAMCERQPVGVCGLITPFNFPMAIPSWKLIPALVCGNAVVMKPAEDVPLSTINLVKACEEAGIPKGVVNVVNGFHEPGEALVNHKDVRLISFTGSTDTGRIIAEQ
nr:aldehyde dehydrogenase family protein [Acidobacteriota bacterium]